MIAINARQAALICLERCRREGAWSGQTMDEIIKKAALEKREAALASRLSLGVLQNSRLFDFYIDCFSSVKAAKLEPKVRDILRMGIYQLLGSNIPARAAVNESVSLCKSSGFERAAGLVNAVLRRVAENAQSMPEIPGAGTAEHLAIKYSHCEWLAKALVADYGYEHTEGFFACNNQPSTLSIQVNRLKISPDAYGALLSENGIGFEAHPYLEGCFELEGGRVSGLPGYDEGLFYVQDAAARAAAEIADAKSGMRVLDACSAPGGKSFASAIRMADSGSILSCDIHEKKLRLVREGAARLGISIIETQAADARGLDESFDEAFDLVIADVPCSGIGVIRKKPEIRWKKEEELSQLPKIQSEILHRLSRCVRPGGILMYSTCTVLKAENEELVRSFLNEHPEYAPEAFTLGDKLYADGMHCFWPNIDGTDGFFAAKLKRIK